VQGVVVAHAELTERVASEVAQSPRRRPALATVEHVLGMLVEIPAALLVVAEIVILFAGVVARYGLHSPLIWSDELASVLFLWLAMLGAAVAFRRAEHMRMTAIVAGARPSMRANRSNANSAIRQIPTGKAAARQLLRICSAGVVMKLSS
jgi:hypothetical protein